jgi:hypothetical protein
MTTAVSKTININHEKIGQHNTLAYWVPLHSSPIMTIYKPNWTKLHNLVNFHNKSILSIKVLATRVHIHNTSFSSYHSNENNKLECLSVANLSSLI